jgi:hypothetical protein
MRFGVVEYLESEKDCTVDRLQGKQPSIRKVSEVRFAVRAPFHDFLK